MLGYGLFALEAGYSLNHFLFEKHMVHILFT